MCNKQEAILLLKITWLDILGDSGHADKMNSWI